MRNLTNEHLGMICKLQYTALKLSNMGKKEYMQAQDLIKAGIAMEDPIAEGEILAVRYIKLTEKGEMILDQLELELNKAVMV